MINYFLKRAEQLDFLNHMRVIFMKICDQLVIFCFGAIIAVNGLRDGLSCELMARRSLKWNELCDILPVGL